MTKRERLAEAFGVKPLLVEAAKLDVAFSPRQAYAVDGGVAVIDIAGLLANEPSLFEEIFLGATGYAQALAEIEDAITDPAVKGVLLRINSPGGDADNAFETAAAIRQMAQLKPIWAVADNNMFSAAYLLGSAVSRIYVPEFTGGVGSVGVYMEHVDWSEYNRAAGIKVTYIAEGEGKTDGNPNEPLSDSARAKLENEVSRLYGLFVSAVAERRGLSQAQVRKLGAALLYGPDAVAAGLADRVGTFRTALADLSALVNQAPAVSTKSLSTNRGGNTEMENTQAVAETPAVAKAPAVTQPTAQTTEQPHTPVAAPATAAPPAAPPVAEPVPAPARTSDRQADAHRAGFQQAREVVELCALAGLPHEAAGLLARYVTSAEARQYLLEQRGKTAGPEIHSHVMPETGTSSSANTSLENNPVLKAVGRLAAQRIN